MDTTHAGMARTKKIKFGVMVLLFLKARMWRTKNRVERMIIMTPPLMVRPSRERVRRVDT